MRFLFRVVVLLLCGLALIIVAIIFYYGSLPNIRCRLAKAGPLSPGSSFRRLVSGGRERCYLLFVPSLHPPLGSCPVVLSLHGFASNPYEQRRYTRWEDLAQRYGFVVVYPQGSLAPLRWNTSPTARLPGVDDAQLVHDILVDLEAKIPLDRDRIYATGFSNGGQMAHQVGCLLADEIAAIGVVAGAGPDPTGGCNPIRPVPVIAFFGTRDPLSEPMGLPDWLVDLIFNVSVEASPPLPSNPAEWASGWASRNACDPQPEVSDRLPGARINHYVHCSGEADVIMYLLLGAGHGWPGGPSIPLLGQVPGDIDATSLMWDFFASHPRR